MLKNLVKLSDSTVGRLLKTFFVFGLAISVLMISRSQISDDSLHLLSRGWLFAAHGIVAPIGNAAAATAGGYVPGSFSAIVTGIPLMLWMDHRAPVVLILIFHIIAYVLLDRVVKAELGNRARLILAIVFWLNPWRLYQSGWVDNSNYVFLAGAVHLWTCYVQRETPKFAASLIMVVAVGLTLQLHLDAVVLAFASILLWWRGFWKPHWGGVVLGCVVTVATLIPFFIEAYHHPEIVPGGGEEPLGSNLIKVWPVLKGFVYWLRYPSLYASNSMTVFDFTPAFGISVGPAVTTLFRGFTWTAGFLALILSVTANTWWFRYMKNPDRQSAVPAPASQWLGRYAIWTLAACLIANGLSPEVTMWWHNLIILHAAIIPIVLWCDALLRTPKASMVVKAELSYALVTIILCIGMALGSAHYRRGGSNPVMFLQPERHQMIEDLGLNQCCISEDVVWKAKQMYFYRAYLSPYVLPDS